MTKSIKIGSRGSPLALWQARHVADLLFKQQKIYSEIIVIQTRGDILLSRSLPMIGGKGLFTEALEQNLLFGGIDIAVHSLKDLPTYESSIFTVAAVLERASPYDVLVSTGKKTFSELPMNAVVGTSSFRRSSQLVHLRPDIKLEDIRGNVQSRISKVLTENKYDATILAKAGIERLDLQYCIAEVFDDHGTIIPAPGQGALAIQTLRNHSCLAQIEKLNHRPSYLCTLAERSFLAKLNGGCSAPIAAYAYIENESMTLIGRVVHPTGTPCFTVEKLCAMQEGDSFARELGRSLAEEILALGAQEIIDDLAIYSA